MDKGTFEILVLLAFAVIAVRAAYKSGHATGYVDGDKVAYKRGYFAGWYDCQLPPHDRPTPPEGLK